MLLHRRVVFFFIFVVFHYRAKWKSVKWPPFLNGILKFFKYFFISQTCMIMQNQRKQLHFGNTQYSHSFQNSQNFPGMETFHGKFSKIPGNLPPLCIPNFDVLYQWCNKSENFTGKEGFWDWIHRSPLCIHQWVGNTLVT